MAGPDAQTRMMERLLADPDFRARFRRDPAAVAREQGAPELANELAIAGDPMQTLDFRESRSSVAGVMMAVAVEGLGIYELGRHVLPGVEDAQAASGGPSSGNGSSEGWDPNQFGQAGAGGRPSGDALALLDNRNVQFDAAGIADLKGGRMDPRVVGVLEAISEKHRITVSATTSDHAKLTAGGSVSNHYYGRAFDIATVDGKPVNAGNQTARRLAEELAAMDPSIRPSEIGSPWDLNGAAYFSDAAHQNHLHVGFDDPIPANWTPPEGAVSAPAAVSSPAAVDMPAVPAAAPDGDSEDGGDGGDSEDGGDGGDENEPDEDESEHDNWDETHESGSPEDSGGSGDDGSSESGSDEDSGGDSDDGSDGGDGSGDGGDSGDAPEAGAASPDDALQLPDDAGGDYPGDDARSEQVAAWMASAAQKRGLPPELPVMASLVESGMKNLSGGDRDSVGFFQMRVGIWNQGAYSGYPKRPELQLQWFLDHAAAVKKQRVADGLSVNDPKQYGDWIADVERPAAQYRGRYQLQLDEAQALLKNAGAKSGKGSGGGLDQLIDGNGRPQPGRRARLALTEARKYLGTPYRWGGSSPKTGFDCSGLVQWAYAKAGIRIPRVTDQQILAANGTKVGRSRLLPGDLVFFRDPTGYVHHVGISLGGDRFLHAPHTGDVVKVSSLKEPYYAQQFTGGRRFDKPLTEAQGGQAAEAAVQGSRNGEDAAARLARAALDRDAAEVRRSNSALFRAVQRQEEANDKLNEVQFLQAVRSEP